MSDLETERAAKQRLSELVTVIEHDKEQLERECDSLKHRLEISKKKASAFEQDLRGRRHEVQVLKDERKRLLDRCESLEQVVKEYEKKLGIQEPAWKKNLIVKIKMELARQNKADDRNPADLQNPHLTVITFNMEHKLDVAALADVIGGCEIPLTAINNLFPDEETRARQRALLDTLRKGEPLPPQRHISEYDND